MKTTALRLDDDTHAQLAMLAQLDGVTVTFAIRQAIADFINAKRQNPGLRARAEAALAGIDQEAASRRDAITSMFEGKGASAPSPTGEEEAGSPPSSRTGRTRSGRSAKS